MLTTFWSAAWTCPTLSLCGFHFALVKSIKVFFNKHKEQAEVWVLHKPFLVAEEGPRRLKQNTKNTKNTRILNCGNVCHVQWEQCADHKHQIKDW